MDATDRDRRTRDYLETAHSLVGELERAMQAISCNGLSDLEESLAEQEVLTVRLRILRRQLWVFNDTQPACLQPALDKELPSDLVTAHAELQAVNRVYDAVLGYSGHSAAQMTSLLGSGKGHFQEASGPRQKYQTWSCRM
ncbi:MAG TPA: hypothetical protein VK814_18405 [Acidobacteriaceae bacterium]|nr:hypothetical protein [Acidobacteriaceae bacterium]